MFNVTFVLKNIETSLITSLIIVTYIHFLGSLKGFFVKDKIFSEL